MNLSNAFYFNTKLVTITSLVKYCLQKVKMMHTFLNKTLILTTLKCNATRINTLSSSITQDIVSFLTPYATSLSLPVNITIHCLIRGNPVYYLTG